MKSRLEFEQFLGWQGQIRLSSRGKSKKSRGAGLSGGDQLNQQW
jgi:hypothetical protein